MHLPGAIIRTASIFAARERNGTSRTGPVHSENENRSEPRDIPSKQEPAGISLCLSTYVI